MRRSEYLQQLANYLKYLPPKDVQDTLDYFNEYFEEAGIENEHMVITELGSPKEAASDILAHLYEKESTKPKVRTSNQLLLIWLSILAAPCDSLFVFLTLILFVCLLVLLTACLLMLASICLSTISFGMGVFLLSIELFPLSLTSNLLFIGISLTAIALGLLFSQATVLLGQKFTSIIFHIIKKALSKGGYYETT